MGSATAAVITRAVDELELATLDFGVEGFKRLGVGIGGPSRVHLGITSFAFLNWKKMPVRKRSTKSHEVNTNLF
jgi:hypothetical protein